MSSLPALRIVEKDRQYAFLVDTVSRILNLDHVPIALSLHMQSIYDAVSLQLTR